MVMKTIVNLYFFSFGVWMLALMFFLVQITVIWGLMLPV